MMSVHNSIIITYSYTKPHVLRTARSKILWTTSKSLKNSCNSKIKLGYTGPYAEIYEPGETAEDSHTHPRH